MIRFVVCVVIMFSQFLAYSQEHKTGVSKVETMDSLIIGKRIKQALKILEIDSLWSVIHEPPMIAQGIQTGEINGYKVQLITERIPMIKIRKSQSSKMNTSFILRQRVIGASWETDGKCRSIGKVIPQYAYDRFGPCEKNRD